MEEKEGMDKFGVSEGVDSEKLEKWASEGCPVCGMETKKLGRLLVCPKHGTEPFERR